MSNETRSTIQNFFIAEEANKQTKNQRNIEWNGAAPLLYVDVPQVFGPLIPHWDRIITTQRYVPPSRPAILEVEPKVTKPLAASKSSCVATIVQVGIATGEGEAIGLFSRTSRISPKRWSTQTRTSAIQDRVRPSGNISIG